MKPDEQASMERRLKRSGATRLLPLALIALLLLYAAGAYVSHETEQRDRRNNDRVIQRGESAIARLAAGSALPPISHRLDADETLAELRLHYGIESNDIPSYTWRGNALYICPNAIEADQCSIGDGFPFALAYTYQLARSAGGLDTWNVVFAPMEKGHFTRDRVRILYRINTAGAKVAVLMASSSDFGEDALPEPIVGQLNSFSDTAIGERIESSANEADAKALNPLGLRLAEMRIESSPDGGSLPGRAQIASFVDGPIAEFGDWLEAEGDGTETFNRIMLVLGALAFVAGFLRIAYKLARFTVRWTCEWRELRHAAASDSRSDQSDL